MDGPECNPAAISTNTNERASAVFWLGLFYLSGKYGSWSRVAGSVELARQQRRHDAGPKGDNQSRRHLHQYIWKSLNHFLVEAFLFVHPECVKNTRKNCAFLAQFAIFVLWKSFHSGFGSNPYTRYDLATMVVRYHVDSSVDAEQARHQPTLNPKC